VPVNTYLFEESQGCQKKGQVPPALLPWGQGAVLPCAFQYDSIKCVCIPVSQIHSIPKVSVVSLPLFAVLRHEISQLTNPGLSNAESMNNRPNK